MIIGLDFGTTNTGAASFDASGIQLLPLDLHAPNPVVCRTAFYLTRGQEYFLGSQAVNNYFRQNIGRPSRYRKIWVGEILQIFAELPPFYRDVFVFEDEFSPGRLFLSIKTALRNPNYLGTVFQDQWFSASDLAAVFLMGMKQRVDRHLRNDVREVVLGRPVYFSSKVDEDKIAQSRLVDAAFKAGFEKVYLEYEPVAAALAYEQTLQKTETILVFDFGGGTLDFTIMEVGGGRRQVFATGGIPIAGDVFDQRLFRVTLPRHLGEGDYFVQNGKRYPIPTHIFDLLTNAQEILSLNTPNNLEMLRSIHLGAQHKKKTEALLKIVSSNYALLLFDVVERAKRQLSDETDTKISVVTKDFTIEERVTRLRFEHSIRQEYEAIQQELNATLDRSGLRPGQIDRVIRTGGSSQIPIFNQLLNDLFGAEKVQSIDTFSSVTSGLGIRARQISEGEIEPGALCTTVWTPDLLERTETMTEKGSVTDHEKRRATPVNLNSTRQRLEVAEDYDAGRASLPQSLALLLGEGQIKLFECAEDGTFQPTVPASWARQAVVGLTHQHALLVTSSYRLLSHELAALFIAQQSSSSGVIDLLRLEEGETVTAITTWDVHSPVDNILCLVTNTGQVRCFDARLLAEYVRPRPFFQLEKRYTGLPAALIMTGHDGQIIIGTDAGRVGQAMVRQAQVVAWESLRAKSDETVTAAASFPANQTILAINPLGQAMNLHTQDFPVEGPVSSRSLFLKRGFSICAFISLSSEREKQRYFITNLGQRAILDLSAGQPPSKAPFQAISLREGEKILYLSAP